MTKEITLNGVSLTELKKTKALIQKDASAFIANGIKKATETVKEMLQFDGEAFEGDEHQQNTYLFGLANEARETLKNVELVSGISGVEFYLPYNSEWGSDGDVLTDALEEIADNTGISYYGENPLSELHGVLEEMESQSRIWNTSTC